VVHGWNRFDSIAYICPAGLPYSCPTVGNSRLTCMCHADFDQLNTKGGHFMAMTFPLWLDSITNNGNTWAYWQDNINDGFPGGSGSDAAQAIYATAEKYANYFNEKFPGTNVPQYFLLNEISFSRWSQNRPGYAQFVIDMVTELSQQGVTPIIFAPFLNPTTKFRQQWSQLAQVAIIAVEGYIDSRKVAKVSSSKRLAYMKKQYAQSVSSWVKAGVPKNRLAYFEHYGNTLSGVGYGRQGVSKTMWYNIIQNRNTALKSLGTWGIGSYGWMGNKMKINAAQRDYFYQAYNSGW